MALTLTVGIGDPVRIGDHITVFVSERDLRTNQVRLVVEAPPEVCITSPTKKLRPARPLLARGGRVLP
jgi:hypothetical protein